MRIAGIGLNAKAGTADIVAALRAAGACDGLACAAEKIDQRLDQAAAALGLPLHAIPREALTAAAPRAETHSPRLARLSGGASLAECAALAAAGEGARLVLARQVFGHVTLAIAENGEDEP